MYVIRFRTPSGRRGQLLNHRDCNDSDDNRCDGCHRRLRRGEHHLLPASSSPAANVILCEGMGARVEFIFLDKNLVLLDYCPGK